jgi:hypothetical protein
MLSSGGILVLLNSVRSSLPMYMMSWRNWITIDLGSFGNVTIIRRSTG